MLMTSHYCHLALVDVDCFNLWSNIKNVHAADFDIIFNGDLCK